MEHESKVTLSIYVHEITFLAYDKETKQTSEYVFDYYSYRLPNNKVLIKELSELFGVTALDIVKTEMSPLSGVYEMPHRTFLSNGVWKSAPRKRKE